MAPCIFLHHNKVSVDWIYCAQESGPKFGLVTTLLHYDLVLSYILITSAHIQFPNKVTFTSTRCWDTHVNIYIILVFEGHRYYSIVEGTSDYILRVEFVASLVKWELKIGKMIIRRRKEIFQTEEPYEI